MNRDEYGYLFDEIYDPTIEMYLEEDSILHDSDSSDNPDGADSIIVAGVAIIFLMFISTFL